MATRLQARSDGAEVALEGLDVGRCAAGGLCGDSLMGMTRKRHVRLRAARGLTGCCGLLVVALGFAPAAGAEVAAIAQAQTANAAFLATAAPPGPAAGICLVDAGVDAGPDTSHVVARVALSGADVDDVSPVKHGTRLDDRFRTRVGFGLGPVHK